MHSPVTIALLIYFAFVALICFAKNDYSLVDIFWPLGFLVVWGQRLYQASFIFSPTEIAITILIVIWALRLGSYLLARAIGRPEDYRYKTMRTSWGKWAPLQAIFKIFLFQAFLMWVVSLPLSRPIESPNEFGPFRIFFFIIAVIAILIETIADLQISQFKKLAVKPSRFLKTGLWKYSRHPNYFGEILFWYSMAAINQKPSALIGPIFLNILILKISGIPLLEKRYEQNEEFQAYKEKTNSLILWFPKN